MILGFRKVKFPFPHIDIQELMAYVIPFISGSFAIGMYGFSDDYSALYLVQNNFAEFFALSLSQGRPLLGFFAWAQFSQIDSLTGFLLTHFVSAIIFGVIGGLMYKIIKNRLVIKKSNALLLATIPLIATPGFNVMVAWGIELGPLLSIAIALIGLLAIYKKNKVSWISLFLILQSFFFYQPSFMFIVGVFLTFQALSVNSVSIKEYLKDSGIAKGLFVFIAFLFQFYVIFLSSPINSPNSRTSVSVDFSGKIQWFFWDASRTILDSFIFWGPGKWEMIIIFSLAVFGFILSTKITKVTKSLPIFLLTLAVICSPNLIISENWASNRSFFPAQWFITFSTTLFIIKVTKNLLNRIPVLDSIVVCAILSVGIWSSYEHLHDSWKIPQIKELELVSEKLNRKVCLETSWVLQSSWTQTLSRQIQFDEFGLPSTSQPWAAPAIFQFLCKDNFGLETRVQLAIDIDEIPKGEKYVNFGEVLGEG
jgi:hypothetical protein